MGAELILLFPIKSASTGPMGPAETAGAKDTAGPAGPAAGAECDLHHRTLCFRRGLSGPSKPDKKSL